MKRLPNELVEMSYYCPQCGSEVTEGNRCPECGYIDEECTSCGNAVDENSWLCGNCETPSSYCPECGGNVQGDTCVDCGTKRPSVCTSCNGTVDANATECPSCGYNPGSKYRRRAKWIRYLMYGFLTVGVLLAVAVAFPIISAGAPASFIGAALIGPIIPAVLITAPLFLLSRYWRKKGNQTVTADSMN